MKKVFVLAALGLFLCGCHTELAPYLGHWIGEFKVEQADPKTPTAALAPNGYVQLYQTGDRFLMEIANPAQKVTIKGTWNRVMTTAGRRASSDRFLTLNVADVKIEEPPLARLKALGRPYIDPDTLRIALSKPIVLTLSADGKTLEGLLTTIGPLLGRFHFEKGNTKIGATL